MKQPLPENFSISQALVDDFQQSSGLFKAFYRFNAWAISGSARSVLSYIEASEKYARWELRNSSQFFMDLSEQKLKQVVTELLSDLGYEARLTLYPNADGFDVFARKQGQTEAWLVRKDLPEKDPGPVLRLRQTLSCGRAAKGIIAVPAGVDPHVKEWLSGDQVELMDAQALVDLNKGFD